MGIRSVWQRLFTRTFFGPAPSQSLALFRFLFCAVLALQILLHAEGSDLSYSNRVWNPIPLFEQFGVSLMPLAKFQLLRAVLVAALLFGALGVFTRVSLTVAWIACFCYLGTALGFSKSAHSAYVYHSQNILIFVLFILSIAPGIAVWAVDGWRRRGFVWKPPQGEQFISAWPTQLVKLTLALAYFGSGYCKVKTSPLWADGYTLQGYLLQKHLLIDNELSLWLAQSFWLCLLVGIGTLLLELTFFLIVWIPRLTWPYVIGGLAFHLGIKVFMNINFLYYFGFVYLVFLDWPLLRRWAATLGTTARPAPIAPRVVGETWGARSVVIGLPVLLLLCIGLRVESWPFTDYRVFQSRHHPSRVVVFRVAVSDENDELHWLNQGEIPASPVTYNARFGKAYSSGDEQELSKILTAIAEHLSPDMRERHRGLVLASRAIELEDGGEIRIVNKRIREVPLDRRQSEAGS